MQPPAQLIVQRPERISDLGLGLARYLAPDTLAARPEAQADNAAPAALAALVKARILTRRAFMIEVDGVLAATSALGSHSSGAEHHRLRNWLPVKRPKPANRPLSWWSGA